MTVSVLEVLVPDHFALPFFVTEQLVTSVVLHVIVTNVSGRTLVGVTVKEVMEGLFTVTVVCAHAEPQFI